MEKAEKQIKVDYLIEQLEEVTGSHVTVIFIEHSTETLFIKTTMEDATSLQQTIQMALTSINQQIHE